MQTSFYINISIRTTEGPKSFGRFNIGEDREIAKTLFKKLKGSPAVSDHDIIYVEFVELVNGLPYNIDMLTCDLHELGTNCMLITQEVFRVSILRA
jgi:hypothetical protein